jgi:hypothetical protein
MHVLGLMYCVWKQTKYVRNFVSSRNDLHFLFLGTLCTNVIHGYVTKLLYTGVFYYYFNLYLLSFNKFSNIRAQSSTELRRSKRWEQTTIQVSLVLNGMSRSPANIWLLNNKRWSHACMNSI